MSSSEKTAISRPLFKFTSKLFKTFVGQQNVVLSPVSIHKALIMVFLGADNGSETRDEFLKTLGLKGLEEQEINKCLEDYSALIAEFKENNKKFHEFDENEKVRYECRYEKPPLLDIFNMFITKNQGNILPSYEQKVKQYFDSSIVEVNDNKPQTKTDVLEKLNGWAKEAGFSESMIEKEELEENFAAILISAIHIQGFWFDEFHEYRKSETPIFYNNGKKDAPVTGTQLHQSDPACSRYLELTSADKAKYKLLHEKLSQSSSAKLFEELSALDVQVAHVALRDGLSFTIFEPLNPSGLGGELDKLVSDLMPTDESSASSKLERVFSLLNSDLGSNRIKEISLPKFSFENEVDLKSHLQSIGLNRVFEIYGSEIHNISTDPLNFYIDSITHGAVIDVNKTGIKAAGYTKISMGFGSCGPMRDENPIIVKIMNPCLFVLRYDELPLFIGRLDSLNE